MPRKAKVEKTSCKGFISLHDFLLIGKVDDESVIDEYKTGPQWIQLYETAKKQFKIYGFSPPVGSFVAAIRSGMGGPIGTLKKLTGIDSLGGKQFFLLDRGDNSQENVTYFVDKLIWWAYFAVIPDGDSKKPKEPESIL